MAEKKARKAPWFRLYVQNRGALEGIDSHKVGEALKAALRYFDSGGEDETEIEDEVEKIAYSIFKVAADESIREYRESIENGRRGAIERHEREKQKAIQDALRRFGGDECNELPFE